MLMLLSLLLLSLLLLLLLLLLLFVLETRLAAREMEPMTKFRKVKVETAPELSQSCRRRSATFLAVGDDAAEKARAFVTNVGSYLHNLPCRR